VSLRWRLSLALALLAGLATVATALIAYVSTEDRLTLEVDRFLAARTAPFRDDYRPPFGAFGHDGHGGRHGEPFPRLEGRLVRFDTEVQFLAEDGEVTRRSGNVQLPVDSADTAIAAGRGTDRYRTVEADGVPYRVLTFALLGGGAVQVARDLTENTHVLTALRWRFLAVGLGIVAAGVLAGWLIARRTTEPLEQLTATAEHVADTGDLEATIATTRRDETGRLARAFSTMLDTLARLRAQQQQLVQDASHELRTPLTSVRMNVDVLRRHRDLPEHQREALLADLHSELGELTTLINELVQLAADQRDDEPVQLVALDALLDRAAARAERRHGREYKVRGQGAIVAARPWALERAATNLLDNAAKFSPDGMPIEINLDGGRITVRDHGPGIDPADLAKVFDRFYRAPAARPLPGSGLGLAIVRQVVESHSGTVFARNHPEGGALVGFELPVANGDAPA
jgi:two-component system sensor histidine kinase MprB